MIARLDSSPAHPTGRRRAARVLLALSAVCVIATVAACGGSGDAGVTPPPTDSTTTPTAKPGALDVVLSTPNANDGAVLFVISGGTVDSMTAGDVRLIVAGRSPITSMALGSMANGSTVARIWVPDVSKAASYAGVVTQAAARTTYAQQAVTGYRLTFQAK